MAYYLGTLYLVSDRIGPGMGMSDRIDGGSMTRTGMDGNKPTTVLLVVRNRFGAKKRVKP